MPWETEAGIGTIKLKVVRVLPPLGNKIRESCCQHWLGEKSLFNIRIAVKRDYLDVTSLARTLSHVAAFLSCSSMLSFLLSVLYLPVVFTNSFHTVVCHVSVYDECNMQLLTASPSPGKGCSDASFRRSGGLNQRPVAAEQVVGNCLTWKNDLCRLSVALRSEDVNWAGLSVSLRLGVIHKLETLPLPPHSAQQHREVNGTVSRLRAVLLPATVCLNVSDERFL